MTSEDDHDKSKFLSGVAGRFTSSPLETATAAWHGPPPDDYEDDTYDEPPDVPPPPQLEAIPPIWFYEDAFHDGSAQVPPPPPPPPRPNVGGDCPKGRTRHTLILPSRANETYQAIELAMSLANRAWEHEPWRDPVELLAQLLEEYCATGLDSDGLDVALSSDICQDPLAYAVAVYYATTPFGTNEPFVERLPLELSWCL